MNDRAHLNHQLQRGACFRCRPVSPAGLEPVFALFFTGTSDDSALSYGTTNFKLLDCLWRPSDRPSDTCSATCQNSKEAFSESAEGLGGGFLSRTCFSPVLYRQNHRENPVGAEPNGPCDSETLGTCLFRDGSMVLFFTCSLQEKDRSGNLSERLTERHGCL